MRRARWNILSARWGLTALAAMVAAVGCDSPTRSAGSIRIEAVTPTELSGTVVSAVTPSPTVRALDENGLPVSGVSVRFSVAEGSGAVTVTLAETDDEGLAASGIWTLGSTAGRQSLTAQVDGGDPVGFSAQAAAGSVAVVEPVAGDQQTALVGDALLDPLTVRVTDAHGNAVTGAVVTFTVNSGGGWVENDTAVTLDDGVARSGVWTLGPLGGRQTAIAESGPARVLFSAHGATLAVTGLEGRMAFVSDRDGDADIYAINVDGTGLQRLTTDPGADETPAWSPDGDRIAFATHGLGESSIWIMSPDGSGSLRLTEGGDPSWSPDGTLIAFTVVSNGDPSIATVRLSDRAVTVLHQVPGVDMHPNFSPDGGRLAFVSDEVAYDFAEDIYTMAGDGQDRVRLTNGMGFWPQVTHSLHPVWSPDGSMIAFVRGSVLPDTPGLPPSTDMRFHVAVMRPDGTGVTDLAWAGDISWSDLLDPGSLTWSPDGRGVAYTFVDCDLLTPSGGCSRMRSVRYVSLDGVEAGILVHDARDPSWRR
ncbi:MAG TPA: hypothetical protein VLA43_15460 [Longimicrobiales bacterium]|nr:hypothetical protein [Longimicrobiales bacterium]